MGLTDQQERAAYSPKSVAVTAGAGTGKTHMLSERYRYFLQQGFSPLQIVAVTFGRRMSLPMPWPNCPATSTWAFPTH
jgi:ATP-dependent exoDNAse (exonuclease V) beta subunit